LKNRNIKRLQLILHLRTIRRIKE